MTCCSWIENPRVSNLLEKICAFNYKISFCPGKCNVAMYALSQIPKHFSEPVEEQALRAKTTDAELMARIVRTRMK